MSHGDASRGDSHETHCREVLAEVWLFLDHECDEARRQLLRRHLDECNPCLAAYGLEEKLKKLLARKCGGEQAPAVGPGREHPGAGPPAGHRGAGRTGRAAPGQPAAQDGQLELGRRLHPEPRGVLEQPGDVTCVGAHGVGN